MINKPKDTGGPAFPTRYGDEFDFEGMTLRDYFAGQAMNGLMSQFDPDGAWDAEPAAKFSYAVADAMLAERAQ